MERLNDDARSRSPANSTNYLTIRGDLKGYSTIVRPFDLSCQTTCFPDKTRTAGDMLTEEDCRPSCPKGRVMEQLHTNNTTRVPLKYQSLADGSIRQLCEKMTNAHNLTVLNLSGNAITCVGVEALVNVLQPKRTVKVLNLYDNKIKDVGAGHLARYLRADVLTECPLQQLDVGRNKITDRGMREIVEALYENQILTHLTASGNAIGNSTVEAIDYTLRKNTTLSHISLSNSKISKPGFSILLRLVREKPFLKHVLIDFTNTAKRDRDLLDRELQKKGGCKESLFMPTTYIL